MMVIKSDHLLCCKTFDCVHINMYIMYSFFMFYGSLKILLIIIPIVFLYMVSFMNQVSNIVKYFRILLLLNKILNSNIS